jgi:predicted site-specific integrase-resolvase
MQYPRILTKQQAADFCQISMATMTKWMREGVVSFRKIGRRVFFDRDRLLDEVLNQAKNEREKQAVA